MKKSRLLGTVYACISLSLSGLSNATTWTEVSDAGELPGTAQEITGNGTLNTINGVFDQSGGADVDMFAIYLPTGQFGAQPFIPPPPDGDPNFGLPQLFLFDSNGIGVSATQDPNTPSLGFNPPAPGVYYLAASPQNIDPFGPKDQFGSVDPIWIDGSSSRTPDGPAASLPVSDWGGSYDGTSSAYAITLTGAEFISAVPIPPSLWLFGSGLLGLIGVVRKKAA